MENSDRNYWEWKVTKGSDYEYCTIYEIGNRAIARHVLPEDALYICDLHNSTKIKPTRNEAMFSTNSTANPFTEYVREICLEKGHCLCLMRNGSIAKVEYCKGDEDVEEGFTTGEDLAPWWLNGKSYKSTAYDLVEIVI